MSETLDLQDTLFSRFDRLLRSGAIQEAHALLILAMAEPATRPEALLWRGLLALRNQAYQQAFAFLANARLLLPERADVLALLARAAHLQGAIKMADTLTELALEIDPLNPAYQAMVRSSNRSVSDECLTVQTLASAPPFVPPPAPVQDPLTQPVDVLVPVYRGYTDTLACLESLITARPLNATHHEIIVLDDASPEPELTAVLEQWADVGAVTLVRHTVNLGFIRGMNRGMARHPDRDVVWLNADTRVCGDWLDRLRDAAYRDPWIASVTPFSNCGELMSFPRSRQCYPLPDAELQVTLDQLARQSWKGDLPDLEVGCGFCLYVKRRALAEVGYLDEVSLTGGYGEDTDWCLRARRRGWRHVGAPGVFVAHRGGVSFGTEKRWRVARNNAMLRQRYQSAEADYQDYLRRDPVGPFRERLQRARLRDQDGRWPAGLLHIIGPDGLDDPRLPFSMLSDVLPQEDLLWLCWQFAEKEVTATLGATWRPLPFLLNYRLSEGLEALLADLASLSVSGLVFHQLTDCPFLELPAQLRLPYILHSLDDTLLEMPVTFACNAAAVLLPFQALLPRYKAAHPQAQLQVVSSVKITSPLGDREKLASSSAVVIADRLDSARIAGRWLALARHFALNNGPFLLLTEATPWEQELQATGQVFRLPIIRDVPISELARLAGGQAAVSLDDDPGAGWMAPALANRLKLPLYAPPSAVGEEAGAVVLPFPAPFASPPYPSASPQEAFNTIIGELTGLAGDVLHGWVLDRAAADVRLCVEAHVDEAVVAVARADQFQGAVSEGDGFHGFALSLRPGQLRRARRIAVRVTNQGPWLPGALMLSERQESPAPPPASQAWFSGGLQIVGWVWDPVTPDRHVEVSVREGGQVLVRAIANQRHPALASRPSDDHGFTIDLPWSLADGKRHELFLESDRGHSLTDSPISVCCHPEGLAALVDRLWPEVDADPARALLVNLAISQDRRSPRNAGFVHYPDWFATFEQPGAMPATSGKIGVLLLGEGTEAEMTVSKVSLANQRLPAVKIWRAAAGELRSALETALATLGEEALLVPLWVGDHLTSHALDHLVALLADPGIAWGYADCDQEGPEGERTHPWFKPAWDLELFFGVDLVSTGSVFRVRTLWAALELLRKIPPDPPFAKGRTFEEPFAKEGASGVEPDWPWLLAAVVAGGGRVAHGPRVLYHRRRDAPHWPQEGPLDKSRLAALQWLAARQAPGALVKPLVDWPGLSQVVWPLPELPKVSLVVPTRDQPKLLRACLEGLLNRTDYPNLEIVVVDNDSIEAETREVLATAVSQGVRVLAHPYPFNYSAINNRAVAVASGTIVGLVNNDIEVLESGWLREMVSQLLRPGVGAVGAKLLWPNGMVQHGGVTVGIEGLAAHVGNAWHDRDPGYLGFNHLVRRQSAVTAACLLVKKADYVALGGLDEQAFPVAFNDVDFCLRLRERGLTVVWTPFARLMHRESASRGKEDRPEKIARAQREQANVRRRWAGRLAGVDPCYHPSLNGDWSVGPFGGLALPPFRRTPRNVEG